MRKFRIMSEEKCELVFTNRTERDSCHEFLRAQFEGIINEPGYELQTVSFTPKVKIVGLSSESDYQTIINDIIEQNSWISTADLSYLRLYQVKRGWEVSTTLFLKVFNDDVFKRLVTEKTLVVQRLNCRVYEYIQNETCLNCSRTGHKKSTCTNSVKCKLCAEEHSTDECSSKVRRCIRCIRSNRRKENPSFPINHNYLSPKCPAYLYEIQLMKEELERQVVNFQ